MSKDMAGGDTGASRSTSGKGSPSHVTLGVSALVHVLLVAPVLYILVLSFQDYTFFSWHPICMTLGSGLFIMEAVFAISGEAYLSAKLSRMNRVTLHWILHTVGLCFILTGFIIIIVNKVWGNRSHFASNHAKLGLSVIILSGVTALGGLFANNTRWLYPRVRPVLIKVVHAFAGICLTILFVAALITGTYTHWWPGGKLGRDLVITSFFFAALVVLVKPVLAAVSRARVILKPPSTNST